MKTHGLDTIIGAHRFFKDLPEQYLALISGCAKNIHIKSGAFLFREKQPANEFFLVREGQIVLEIASPKSGPIPIQTIHKDEVFGWAAIVPPYEWHFDALVQSPLRAISIDAKCLRTKCERDPEL